MSQLNNFGTCFKMIEGIKNWIKQILKYLLMVIFLALFSFQLVWSYQLPLIDLGHENTISKKCWKKTGGSNFRTV